jgi:uncharacterized protein (DUF362 family)
MKNELTKQKGIERRNFLKALSVTGAGSMLLSNNLLANTESSKVNTSKVVIISDENASDKITKKLNANVVQAMVDDGIKNYTGLGDLGEAWKSIFPGITAASVIGIKVNTLFNISNNGTHPEVANAVINGLKKMDFGGTSINENNIIIFDFGTNYLSAKGYKINTSATGVRCFASPTYSTEEYTLPDNVKHRLSNVIVEDIDFLINIAYLKHHFLSGVSLCLKNHYGSIQYPENNVLMHDTNRCGDPYIPAITALDPIKTKQKICIIDAIYGLTKGGPYGQITCNPDKIVMGQDVVAVDCVGREMLINLGLSSTDTSKTKHIDTAATKYSLGTNDMAKIEKIEIKNNTTGIVSTSNLNLSNYPNPFTANTTISFNLLQQENVSLNVYDYSGKLITKLLNQKLDAGTHTVVWNAGNQIKNGIYIAELRSKTKKETHIMQKIE